MRPPWRTRRASGSAPGCKKATFLDDRGGRSLRCVLHAEDCERSLARNWKQAEGLERFIRLQRLCSRGSLAPQAATTPSPVPFPPPVDVAVTPPASSATLSPPPSPAPPVHPREQTQNMSTPQKSKTPPSLQPSAPAAQSKIEPQKSKTTPSLQPSPAAPQKSKSRVMQKAYTDPGVIATASRVRDIEDKWRLENRVPYEKPWYIIDPRCSRGLGYWDACTSLALLFTAIFTPIEVGFIPMPEGR